MNEEKIMWIAKIMLLNAGIAFGGYGPVCMLYPKIVEIWAGMGVMHNASAICETVAMYGGTQFAIGIYFILQSTKNDPIKFAEGLRTSIFVLGGMSSSRFLALAYHGFSREAFGPYYYNLFAVSFESITTICSIYTLIQLQKLMENKKS
jgi:hypothetical protein